MNLRQGCIQERDIEPNLEKAKKNIEKIKKRHLEDSRETKRRQKQKRREKTHDDWKIRKIRTKTRNTTTRKEDVKRN